nr:Chain B, PB1-11 [synthetic construct]
DYNPYLLFLK